MLRTIRRSEASAPAENAAGEAIQDHAPESAHDFLRCNQGMRGLNTRSSGKILVRSPKRRAVREGAAADLADAMKLSGMSDSDIGAYLDFAKDAVRDLRLAEKPFEVGHLDILPEVVAAIILARLVARLIARLGSAGTETFESELRVAKEAA